MKYGFCSVSVAPIRENPSYSSEMVSQLLFGETVEILSRKLNWRKIRLLFDDYVGWVDEKQILLNDTFDEKANKQVHLTINLFDFGLENYQYPFPFSIGSEINLHNGKIYLGENELSFDGELIKPQKKIDLSQIAKTYLNVPYLWGGKSAFGIDCSGFIQQVFKFSLVNLPRDAYQQAQVEGQFIHFLEQSKPGDLAFFENDENKIIHVGMLLDNQYIIHAHGKVRIDKIDQTGIFNLDHKTHSHKLRFIKRIT